MTVMHVRLIIAGSRGFTDYPMLVKEVDSFLETDVKYLRNLSIISGMAKGADSLGLQLAEQHKISTIQMPANWDAFGRAAGYKRNEGMARIATHLIAFWDGASKGTKHMIDLGDKYFLKSKIITYGDSDNE